jgi:NADH-quinone oxidoreductase subunit F
MRQSLKILEAMTTGKSKAGDIEILEALCEVLTDASLCALGTSAANPVLSALKHFRAEFEAHVNEHRCPALVCRELVHYAIDPQKCTGCLLCKKECPTNAIAGERKQVHTIDYAECIKCGNCLNACPKKFNAVRKAPGAYPQNYHVPVAAAPAAQGVRP